VSILVFNAGSSSLKFEVFDDGAKGSLGGGSMDWSGGGETASMRAAVSQALDNLKQGGLLSSDRREVIAAGHRVVHGGTRFQDAVVIDQSVRKAVAELAELAPLHNPPALESILAAQEALPNVPHVAVFDTAFFSKLPARAYVYPGPYEWFTEWGIRRFGFHGISHEYCAQRAAQMLGADSRRADTPVRTCSRIVICHLGHGCSATAVREGEAVATTMGFTPLEGLMMGTRTGSIDPGILLHLQQRHGLSPTNLDETLNRRSGLLGVSGVSSDIRKVQAAAKEGNARAILALEIYADRIRAAVGALTTTLGGIDALVFTAGVGENNAELRAAVCSGLEHLGLRLDAGKNIACKADQDISASDAQGRILVLRTREGLMIARVVRRLQSREAGFSANG
jgi:acetate kinase